MQRIETAHSPALLGSLLAGSDAWILAKSAAIDRALNLAYLKQWDAVVNVPVDENYPVLTPNCKRSNP